MPRVLVVDDEQGYRVGLEQALSQAGHETRTAASAREAIDLGARYRPDVLVADWMLKDRLHGLHVAEALHAVRPELQTVMITGFGSADLRFEADRLPVFEFLEKPFSADRVCEAVRNAAACRRPSQGRLPVGVCEVDAAGRILYANPRARQMFVPTAAGPGPTAMRDLLAADSCERLSTADRQWVQVSPRGLTETLWHVRARALTDEGDRMVVFLGADEEEHRGHPVVRNLLGLNLPARAEWPVDGHVLVVDNSALVRLVLLAGLEQVGCICHATDDLETALRLFERDPDIGVVVLDCAAPGEDTRRFIERLRVAKPACIVVGTATAACQAERIMADLDHFLHKPFIVEHLIKLLTSRIGNCVDCGLPIPLRRLRPGEVGSSWECCGCGSRYFAVLDDRFSVDVLRNVRPAPRISPRIGSSN